MSSILTNTSAMVALQTMKNISMNLAKTTSDISTGKNIASAKDNAAVWAISKTMESDVAGFKGISDSLALGSTTIAVARQAAETVTKLLTDIKGKIVSAQEENMDRDKLQTDIDALKSQIDSVVGAAQFNGLNLVNNSTSVNILSSLDRASDGTVTASQITVTGQDLSTGGYVSKAVFGATTNGVSAGFDTAGSFIDAAGTGTIAFDTAATFAQGDRISISVAGKSTSYTVTAADEAATSPADLVAVGLKKAIEGLNITGLTVDYDQATAGTLVITNNTVSAALVAKDINVSLQFNNAGSGGLGALDAISVLTTPSATTALGNIDSLLDLAISAATEFGSVGSRIDIQKEFVGKLTDAMKAGIGSLVDADMEEASARLQALQVQQQLSTQALSIANQQPQSLLSLFR